jgi:uncharacterized protein with PQ loop repeat
MNTVDLLGWSGAGFLTICSLPQGLKVLKQGHSKGLSTLYMWLWFLGELLTFVYVCIGNFSWPLFANYATNLTLSVILLKYYYFPVVNYEKAEQDNKES